MVRVIQVFVAVPAHGRVSAHHDVRPVASDNAGQIATQVVDAPIPVADRFARLGCPRDGPLHRGSAFQQGSASRLQPIAQCCSRQAVVSVVGRNLISQLLVDRVACAELECELEIPPTHGSVTQIERAREAMQRLELLEAIAFDADAQSFTNDRVQVDETPATQQPRSSNASTTLVLTFGALSASACRGLAVRERRITPDCSSRPRRPSGRSFGFTRSSTAIGSLRSRMSTVSPLRTFLRYALKLFFSCEIVALIMRLG